MQTLADIRKAYPQYEDMSDVQLANALHDKFYSDLPKADFFNRIGVEPDFTPVTTNRVTSDEIRARLGLPGKIGPMDVLALVASRAAPSVLPPEAKAGVDVLVRAGVSKLMDKGAQIMGKSRFEGVPMTGPGGQYGRGVIEGGLGVLPALPGAGLSATALGEMSDRAAPATEPRNGLERLTRTAGRMSVNALAPGSLPARLLNVAAPTVGAFGAGEAARAAGADEQTQALAQILGGAAGGVAANVRLRPRGGPTETAVDKFAGRAKPDLDAMRARAQDYRSVGISPTLSDITDESGRGVIRATASRMTPGRQVAQDFGDRRALDLPDRIGGQARTVLSSDARTPAEIADQLSAARGAAADKAFDNVRYDPVDLEPSAVGVLKIPDVVDAIADAMRRERDPTDRALLGQVLEFSKGGRAKLPGLTVGAVDRVSRVLLSKSRGLWANDADLAATLSKYGNTLRDAAKDQSGGYKQALEGYAAQSRLIEGAERGEDFLKRNTDEFVADTAAMSPQERTLARATARRAVERAAGENVGAAPGVARRIAEAPEQQARNRALLGATDATRLERGMRLEEQSVRNARDIAPRTGSQTQNKAQDTLQTAGEGVRAFGRGMRGDFIGAALDTANMWLKSRGFNDAEAEKLVRMATDPGQTDAVMSALEGRLGRQGAVAWAKSMGPRLLEAGKSQRALTSAAAITAASSQQQRRRTSGR